MAVILRSFQSCWTIKALTGPAQAKGYCLVYKAIHYHFNPSPKMMGWSANLRDVLGATLASHGDKQSSGCNRSLQVPIPGQPLPVIWARMLRDQTRANGQPPRSLKRPRLSYTINRFDTTKYFKIEQRWKWTTQHSMIFAPLVMVTGLFGG